MRTDSENKKLAQLLYPNVKMTVEDLFEKFPPRNLPEGAEVTRVAPSPTGYFHLGGVFQSLLDRTLAKKTNGIFLLRIEDTDSKREVKDAGEIAYDMLLRFGLKPDEGFQTSNVETGSYGPYMQSRRVEYYHVFAKRLVETGHAFPCFCKKSESKADVLKRREEELEDSQDIEGHDPCRDMSLLEIEKNLKEGKPWALRLYSTGNPEKTFKVKDRIKGEREIRENGKDVVLVKSDGIPPYCLAHVVDDTLMRVTTVVRGEEWYPSWAVHLEIFKALGLKPPKYAHTPVICKEDNGTKRKLSKRVDLEANSMYFIEQGYPVNGVIEYLMNLLNSDFEMWRLNNPTKSYNEFNFTIGKIGSNNPMYDSAKLDDVCKNYISRMTAKEVFEETLKWAQKYDIEFANILEKDPVYATQVLNIDREKPRPRKDIAKWSDVPNIFFYMFNELFWAKTYDLKFPEKLSKEDIKAVLLDYAASLRTYSSNEDWFGVLKQVAERCGFASDMKMYKANPSAYKGNVADVSTVIRVAITTKSQSPDLYEIISLLGIEETKKRLLRIVKG